MGPPGPAGESGVSAVASYGSFYRTDTLSLDIIDPGEQLPIPYSGNGVVKDLIHEAGSPDVMVMRDGDYEVRFTVYFKAKGRQAGTFAIQINGVTSESGVFRCPFTAKPQMFSGTAIYSLISGDSLRVIFTSDQETGISLQDGGVSAVLTIRRLG